jgi:hypothetical protein
MNKLFKYNIKKIDSIASISKLVIVSFLISSLLIIVLSISNSSIPIFGQNDTINNNNQVKDVRMKLSIPLKDQPNLPPIEIELEGTAEQIVTELKSLYQNYDVKYYLNGLINDLTK